MLKVLGWIIIVIGVIGLVVPFIQGIILIVFGVFLISMHNPALQNDVLVFIGKVKTRWKSTTKIMDVIEKIYRRLTSRQENSDETRQPPHP